jgi:hypothetical protein
MTAWLQNNRTSVVEKIIIGLSVSLFFWIAPGDDGRCFLRR